MIGSPGSEQFRERAGFILLVGGLLFIFFAWGSWLYRSDKLGRAQAIVRVQTAGNGDIEGATPADRAKVARALWLFLIFGLALVLFVVFGTYAIIRAGRRYKSSLEPTRNAATDARDAWAMHAVPDPEDDEDGGGPSTGFGAGLPDGGSDGDD